MILFLLIVLIFVSFLPYEKFEGDTSNIPTNNSLDVPIYDKPDALYNLGDILNMPHYWKENFPLIKYSRFKDVVTNNYKGSIGDIYYSTRPDDEDIPNENRICQSVDEYINRNGNKFKDLIDKVSNPENLTVHIRSGDKGVIEDLIVDSIKGISANYKQLIILSGVHSDLNHTDSLDDSKNKLSQSLNKIKNGMDNNKIIFDFSEADIHLSLMRKSSNLYIHKGGFSILGSIVFQGNNLYVSPHFDPRLTDSNYMIELKNKKNVILL
jgi:hypothetical protein